MVSCSLTSLWTGNLSVANGVRSHVFRVEVHSTCIDRAFTNFNCRMDKTEYRVLIQNKFEAIQFDDDAGDDPLERINKLKEQEALAKKNVAAAPKPAQVKKPLPAEIALKNEKNEKNIPPKSAPVKPFGPRSSADQPNKFTPSKFELEFDFDLFGNASNHVVRIL